MRWRLYDNWRDILKKAWSIKFILVAGFLSGCEVALQIAGDAYFQPGTLAALSAFFCGAAFIARLVAQKDV